MRWFFAQTDGKIPASVDAGYNSFRNGDADVNGARMLQDSNVRIVPGIANRRDHFA